MGRPARGSIEERSDGSYRLSVRHDNERYRRTIQAGSRKEAEAELLRFRQEVTRCGPETGMTTTQLLDAWIRRYRTEWSPTTLRRNISARRHIDRYLGRVPVAELTTRKIDAMYVRLSDADQLAPLTVRKTHACLRRALRFAIAQGLIELNPAQAASPPRVKPREHTIPTDDELAVLLAEADKTHYGPLFRVCAATSARIGEICALRWTAIDFDYSTITIGHSIAHTPENTILEKDTKTHAKRTIHVGASTMDLLRRRQSEQMELAMFCEASLAKDAYVFSDDPQGLTPLPPGRMSGAWTRIRKRAGVETPVRLHDLRHFGATKMLAMGMEVPAVADRLGHTDGTTTLRIYARGTKEADTRAASIMEELLGG